MQKTDWTGDKQAQRGLGSQVGGLVVLYFYLGTWCFTINRWLILISKCEKGFSCRESAIYIILRSAQLRSHDCGFPGIPSMHGFEW